MSDLKKRGFKEPLENEHYDIGVINFNTNNLEDELGKLVPKEDNEKT